MRFYIRSPYVLALPALVVFGLFRGLTWETLVLLAGVLLVVTLPMAAFAMRRKALADEYVPPHAGALGALPASAVFTADRRERRRGLAIVWWGGILASGIAVCWGVAELIEGGGTFVTGSFGGADLLFVVGVVLWVLLVAHFIWTRPALSRGERLAEQYPNALVTTFFMGTTDTISAGMTLREACRASASWWRARVSTHSTVVVDDEGIAFWRGWARLRRQYLLPWAAVGGITPAFVDVDGTGGDGVGLGIELEVRLLEDGRTEGWDALSFRPTRSTLWATYPYRRRDAVEAFAAAIEARRPRAADLFRGTTLAETQELLEEYENAGETDAAAALLDDLRAWRDQRGGALPEGADWLRERLEFR
ncbi:MULTISPECIES: hypothetical protein [unclassified Microbacterium]|uniref:hypothetical protein n=1 Tax=unclassified Microbacterium TaxID=2609290 RepID=UPI0012F89EDA|nr:hypothetical protein [Microbacterium sp. MAH-37]MVQ40643.1 hypothetical protein [Microbacterium sp. MAH-37]